MSAQFTSTFINQTDFSNEEYLYAIAADSATNAIYASGSYQNPNLLESLLGISNLDGTIARLDNSGNIIWTNYITGTGSDEILSVCIGRDGNIYVTGYYSQVATLSTQSGATITLTNIPAGNTNPTAFIASYTPAGALRWAVRDGGSSADYGMSITSTSNGVVAVGNYTNKNAVIQGVAPAQNLNAAHNDVYIVKYGFAGNPLWYVTGGSSVDDYTGALSLTNQRYDITSYLDKIYVTGMYGNNNITFSGVNGDISATAVTTIADPDATEDAFLIAINNSGSVQWGRAIDHGNGYITTSIAADCGGVYVGGNVTDFISHGGSFTDNFTSTNDLYLSGFTLTGAHSWTKMLTSAGATNTEYLRDLIVDNRGNFYFTGDHSAPMTIGPSTLPAATSEVYLAQYNNTGNYKGHVVFNGTNTDVATCIGKLANGKIAVGGFSNSDLDADQGIFNGSYDAFVWGLSHTLNVNIVCCNTVQSAGSVAVVSSPVCQGSLGIFAVTGNSSAPTWQYSADNVTYSDLSFSTATINFYVPFDGYLRVKISDALCGTTYSNIVAINVQEPPAFSCPSTDRVIELTSCSTTMPNFVPAALPTCPSLIYTQNIAVGTELGVGVYPISIIDWNANVVCTFDLRVEETNRPAISCPNSVPDLISTDPFICGVPLPDYLSLVSVVDECTSFIALTQSPPAGTLISSNTLVEITATDIGNNSSSCQFTVNFLDQAPPFILACPSDSTFYVDETCSFVVPDYVAILNVADNCDNAFNISQDPAPGTVINNSMNVVIKAEDNSGNLSVCSPFIYLRDTIDPVISGCPSSIGEPLNSDCEFTILDYTTQVTASDNCSLMLFYQTPAPGTVANAPTIVTIWAIDAQDNYARCEILVSGFNPSPPTVVACPSNQNIIYDNACSATLPDYLPNVVLSGNCLSNNLTQIPAAGTAINNTQLVEIFYEGNLVCSFNVTPIDITPPNILTAMMDQYIPYTSGCAYVLPDYTSFVNANDNCDNNLNYVQVPAPGTFATGISNVVIFAIDDFSNSSSVTFNVEGFDNTAPVIINCPGNQTISNNNNCQYLIPDYRSTLNVSDNCGVNTVTQSPAAGTTHSGVTTITLTVTDTSNNSTSCSFTLTGIDVTAPTISCPSNTTLNANASCSAILPSYTAAANAQDHCDASLTLTQTPAAGTLVSGVTTVTIRATDDAGLFIQCSFTVTVIDITAPTIAPIANQTINFNANCEFVMPNYSSLVVATDNCDSTPTLSQNPPAGTIHNGPTNVQITATDDAGHNSQAQFQVIPVDATAPSITCPGNKTVFYNSACGFLLPNYTSQATISDNCHSNNTYNLSQSPAPSTTITSPTTVTITVTDQNSLQSSCSFLVTPIDNNAPVLTCPPAQSVNLGASCTYVLSDYRTLVTATDNCTSPVTLSQSPAPGTLQSGSIIITITGTDATGNTSQCSFAVNANDATLPTVTCPTNRTLALGSNCTVILPDYRGLVSATDNCDATLTITQTPAAGTSYSGPQTQTIAFSISDDAGNTRNCSFVLSIQDTTAPVITCPANQIASQNASCNYVLGDYRSLATVSDNCSSLLSGLVVTQMPAAGTVINAATSVTLTATDASGNFTSCTFSVTLQPNNTISITCPGNKSVDFSSNCNFVLADYTSEALVSAACGASYTVTQSPIAGTLLSGATTVTLTATNTASQQASCTFIVSPFDNTAPVITCPNNLNVPFNAACAYTLLDYRNQITASDNCTASLTIAQTPTPGVILTTTTTVVITATDAAGNSSSCNFTVTPVDISAPSITCPATQLVSLGNNCTYTLNDYRSLLTASDNCGAALTLTQSPAIGSLQTGNISVTLTASDPSGNISTCSFNVVATDATAPIVSCPADQTLSLGNSCSVVLPDYRSLVIATDNCDASPIINQSPTPGTILNGTQNITVTFTVLDDNGNATDCSIAVNIVDQQAPNIICPSTQTSIQNSSCEYVLGDYTGLALATDNCTNSSSITIVQTPPAGFLMTVPTSVTLTATDLSGNNASCSFVVQLQTNNTISLSCPNNQIVNLDNDCNYVLADYTGQAVVSVSCGGTYTVVQSPAPGSTFSTSTPVTLTATSDIGQQATCTFNVQPIDITAPMITCIADQNIASDADCNYIIPDYTSLISVIDNCGGSVTLIQTPAPGTLASGTSVILITATDVSNNSASCSFVLSTVDIIAPQLTCPIDQSITLDSDCSVSIPDYTSLVSYTDNCGGSVSMIQSPSPGALATGVQVLPITITAQDASGNSSTCTFQLALLDQTAPSINCTPNQTIPFDANCEFILPDYTTNIIASDACSNVISFVQTPTAGTIQSSAVTVEIEALDEAGNGNTCSFLVTPIDQLAPIITCPSTQTIQPDADCSAVVGDYSALANVSDNCNTTVSITQIPAAGTIIFGSTVVQLIASDDFGNSSTCSFDLEVEDTTPPTIFCPADVDLPIDQNCEALVPDFTTSVIASDNCTIDQITQSPLAGSSITASTPVIITVTDVNGLAASCTVQINILDNIAPSITCPLEIQGILDATCAYSIVDYSALLTASDNCNSTITLSQSIAENTIITSNTIITFEATDASGNSATCDATIILVDTIAPSITCPSEINVFVTTDCTALLEDYLNLVVTTEECGNSNTLQAPAAGTSVTTGDVVTFTSTDDTGNLSTCVSQIIRVDTIAPTLICPSDSIVPAGANCEYEIPNLLIEVIPSDNCPGQFSFTQQPASGTLVQGQQIVTITVSDQYSNTATCEVSMITVDNEAPSLIACMPNSTVQVSDCIYTLPSLENNIVVSDNCDADLTITQFPTVGTNYTVADSVIDILFTIIDDNGNSNTCTSQIFLIDTIAPIIDCPSDTILYTTAIDCFASLFIDQATVAQTCENIATSNSPNGIISQLNDFGLGNTTIIYYAEDEEGNISSCIQNIMVVDTIAPAFDCPSDQTLILMDQMCSAEYEVLEPIITEACGLSSFTSTISFGLHSFALGNTSITYTATDISGNIRQCVQNIDVLDLLTPIVTCNDSIFFDSSSEYCGNLVILDAPTVIENCTVSNITSNLGWIENSPNYFDVGVINFIWEVTDQSGNEGTCTTVITITDVTAPVIECETLITGVTNEDLCSGFAFPNAPAVTDNCGVLSITNDLVGNAPYSFDAGTSFIEYIATDIHGNSSSCITEVRIDDIQAPDIICPLPLVLEATTGCDVFALMNNPTASDNCSTTFNIVNNITGNTPVSGLFSLGITPVEYVVFDQAGQSSTCSTTITVVDVSAPVLTCVSTIELTVPADACVVVSDYVPTATDVCGNATVTMISGSANHIYNPGDYLEVWQAIDEYNNSSTCEVSIHVVDITAPTIVCPNDTLVCASVFEFETPLVSDNCTGASWTQTNGPNSGQSATPGIYTIEYTAVDNFGLTNTCSFQYEVIPIAELTVNFPIDSICANASVVDLTSGIISNLSFEFDANAPSGLFNPADHATGWINIEVTAGTGTCQLTLADSIYVNAPLSIDVLADDVFCGLEGTLSLNAVYENLNWNLPANVSVDPLDEVSFTATASEYGFYNFDLSGTDENGCFSSGNFSITFEQNPSQPNAGADQTIFQITETAANGSCDPVFNISWTSESNATIVNPSELSTAITNLTIGTHLFILTNATENCGSLSDSIYIYVRGLEIPSGFSPNGDGTNDFFEIPGIENEPASVSIFNRWGKEVWVSESYKNDWNGNDQNGEALQDDTYFYEIIQANETSTGFVIIKRK